MLAAVISNVSGKVLKKPVDMSIFLPHYLQEAKPAPTEKSIEQQAAEFAAFRAKYEAAERKAKGK
jgi:hypothetical protein